MQNSILLSPFLFSSSNRLYKNQGTPPTVVHKHQPKSCPKSERAVINSRGLKGQKSAHDSCLIFFGVVKFMIKSF
jgi:hypothetical protein